MDKIQQLVDADIVNLHWVEKFFSLEALKWLVNKGKPIVWTMHDTRPMTGGCHYTSGCESFIDNACHQCTQLIYDRYHLPGKVLQAKLELLKDANLTIVSPSKWLAEEARKSALFRNHRVETIPNSVELHLFKPANKQLSKRELGMNPDGLAIMFGAQNSGERRKGFKELLEAVQLLSKDPRMAVLIAEDKLSIVTIGQSEPAIHDLPIRVHEFGSIDDDTLIAKIYSASDLFALPSLEDNLPNTMLEAMACGTPVVGFSVGGIPDLVENWKTGLLVNSMDHVALSLALSQLLSQRSHIDCMSITCSDLIRNNFSQKMQANRYIELFSDVVKTKTQTSKHLTYSNHQFDDIIGYSVQSDMKHSSK